MARSLILHIGHYKTGTTSLQYALESNSAQLARRGLHYAKTSLERSKHSALAFSALHEAGTDHLLFGYKPRRKAWALWSALLAEARALPDGHSLIASSEELIRFGAHPSAGALLKRVAAEAEGITIRVVAYLRDPQDHLLSYYNQLVKMGAEVPGLDAAITAHLEPIHWDYALALAPWIEAFGAEAIVLRQYSDELRQDGALLKDFATALGLQLPPRLIPPGMDLNARLDPSLVDLRRALNRSRLGPRLRDAFFSRLLDSLIADRAQTRPVSFDEIRERCRSGIEALATLPGAALDVERMLTRLPEPQSAPELRQSEVTAMLLAEIADLRATLAAQSLRIARLERDGREPSDAASDAPDQGASAPGQDRST